MTYTPAQHFSRFYLPTNITLTAKLSDHKDTALITTIARPAWGRAIVASFLFS